MRAPGFRSLREKHMAALIVSTEVAAALAAGRPVVALESTLIAHGLPRPSNLETAREAEAAVSAGGAIPATIAILHGEPTVGLSDELLVELAESEEVSGAAGRDLGAAIGLKRLAATTVSATMAFAHAAGIRVFATGGIGAHREEKFDVSADLFDWRTRCSWPAPERRASCISRTLRSSKRSACRFRLQNRRVPGLHGGNFTLPVSCRVESAAEAAEAFQAHVETGGAGRGAGAQCPADVAVNADEFAGWLGSRRRRRAGRWCDRARVTPPFPSRAWRAFKRRADAAANWRWWSPTPGSRLRSPLLSEKPS